MYFCLSIKCIRERFKILNILLKKKFKKEFPGVDLSDFYNYQNVFQNQKKLAESNHHIQDRNQRELMWNLLRQIQLTLIINTEKINNIFGIIILVQLITTFSHVSGYFYHMYVMIKRLDLLKNRIRLIHHSYWILIYIFKLIYVVESSENFMKKARKTNKIVHAIQVSLQTNTLSKEINQTLLQIMLNPIILTIKGLTNMDHFFLREYCGSILLFLLTFAQFHKNILRHTDKILHVNGTLF
ncbi:uncharacterized protein LOC106652812 [Trichogramma pretiosum]|uniref:uncharacterized protein LOC106652812 n=1 Tax=Trichogramma pretiosum TaxID=7493 RepID=UPI0006C99CCA|nr:uncharacterized protein LOC106652812 [Trichogramma pretiosum]